MLTVSYGDMVLLFGVRVTITRSLNTITLGR